MDVLDSILEELALALASIGTFTFASLYSCHKSIARNLEGAPTLTVSHDLSKALSDKPSLPYAVITGRVFPSNGKMVDTLSGMPAVIAKLNVKEIRWVETFHTLVTNSKLDFSDSTISPALRFVPFALSNPNNAITPTTLSGSGGTFVVVDDVSTGTFDDLLMTAKATYVPSEVTLTGLLASLLRGFHSVGVETSESVLPVGTVITVIGEVTKLNGEKGGFRVGKSGAGGCTTPYILTTKNILEVRSGYRAQVTAYKVLSLFFGCMTVMSLYYLGKKYFPRLRLRRIQRIIRRQREEMGQGTEGLSESQICIACLQHRREVSLMPCGHVCLCADCSLLIHERCPVCRQNVTDTHPIFLV